MGQVRSNIQEVEKANEPTNLNLIQHGLQDHQFHPSMYFNFIKSFSLLKYIKCLELIITQISINAGIRRNKLITTTCYLNSSGVSMKLSIKCNYQNSLTCLRQHQCKTFSSLIVFKI